MEKSELRSLDTEHFHCFDCCKYLLVYLKQRDNKAIKQQNLERANLNDYDELEYELLRITWKCI